MALVNCKECGKGISTKAPTCPHCGAPTKKRRSPIGCAVVLGFFLVCFIAAVTQNAEDTVKKSSANHTSAYPPAHTVNAHMPPKLDVPSLRGQRVSELRTAFPELATAELGSSTTIEGWGGWKVVYLDFDGAARLEAISFAPAKPLSEPEAKRIVEEDLGVSLPPSHEQRPPALIAYRDMPGNVGTVNFHFVDWKADRRIKEIDICYNIGGE